MENIKPIITLTTIPSRLISIYNFDIKYSLESLLNQLYDDFEIHLNIPHVCKKTNEEYVIPEWLFDLESNNQKLKIYRTEDYGPITKLLPTLMRVTDPEQIIIVVDDDMIYNENMLKEQVNNQQKWIECPVGYDGIRSRNDEGEFSTYFDDMRNYYFSATHRNSRVDILQHYKTISYKRRFFGDDFYSFVDEYHGWNDDITISAYFAMHKRDRMVTFYPDDVESKTYDEWLINVGRSFPIIKSTQHDTIEGCNLFRRDQDDDGSTQLYKFIDSCYTKN